MKRKLIAALYDPYLDTLGGGEKHILSILKVLDDEGYEICIFWNKNLQSEIQQRFGLQYVNRLNFLPNIFTTSKPPINTWLTLRNFDFFLYVTNGSYFFSSAKRNFIFCMVPQRNLYQMNIINKLKTLNYKFITNSNFTQKWLNMWGITSHVIYPYVNSELIDIKVQNLKKEKIILTIGRFFGHLHSKKQSILISLFKQIKQTYPQFKNFKLIIAGGLKEEDKQYLSKLSSLVNDRLDIALETNFGYNRLIDLYRKSLFYVHFTGYGTDENVHPDQVEHLGIAPIEAMAGGCVVFCYNAGGPKEIIANGQNGFLFSNEKELVSNMLVVLDNQNLQKQIQLQAQKFVKDRFSYGVFKKRVKEVLL